MPEAHWLAARMTGRGDPRQRAWGFEAVACGCPSFEAAVEAARFDYLRNVAPGADAEFTVYRSAGGDGLVEVSDRRGPLRLVGLYKVLASSGPTRPADRPSGPQGGVSHSPAGGRGWAGGRFNFRLKPALGWP
jgi:hypothetical protein